MRTRSRLATLLVLAALFCIGLIVPALAETAAPPVIGPPVEQNGLRFESWLASSKVVIPDKILNPKKNILITPISIRVTNLSPAPLRVNPFAFSLTLIGPNGKELSPSPMIIHGYVRQPQEEDYVLLQPGQSQILSNLSGFFWRDNHLCLWWRSNIDGHPFVYEGVWSRSLGNAHLGIGAMPRDTAPNPSELFVAPHTGLFAGSYSFSVRYEMTTQGVQIHDDHTGKTLKTLNGFWTGDVTMPRQSFQLVTQL